MTEVEYKNREVEQAKAALEEKAEQLALSSRYKSEFLANMSHELRTPLNSLLILARMLSDNADTNLTPKQIEYAQTIHAAGTDLLSLINDILDLAKIESGTVTLNIAPEHFSELRDYVERTFRQVAHDKGLEFTVDGRPRPAAGDPDRREAAAADPEEPAVERVQVHRARARCRCTVAPAKSGWTPGHPQLDAANQVVAFSVTDTGIGIPENKQKIIFEAFQQADGTTSRQYGGTGLGLSISRELTRLLGGEIQVVSAPGKGSTFTLYLPLTHQPARPSETRRMATRRGGAPQPRPARSAADAGGMMRDGAARCSRRRRCPTTATTSSPATASSLIVEDDTRFAATLLDLARESGFKGVVATERRSTALALVKELAPDAITLDLKLPDMDGWAVLDLLKHDPGDPAHPGERDLGAPTSCTAASTWARWASCRSPRPRRRCRRRWRRTREFIERDVKTLLIASGDEAQRDEHRRARCDDSIEITAVDSGKEALETLRRSQRRLRGRRPDACAT